MATRGLISSLFVGIWIAFLLADCSSFPRKSFTREQQDLAGIPGIADARIWADDPAGLSRAALFSYGQHKPASIDILALSGGGAEGAFGAGLLVGWTEAGNRPEFSMISGTSSSALDRAICLFRGITRSNLERTFYRRLCRDATARRWP